MPPILRARDVVGAAGIALLLPLARLVPSSHWWPVCAAVARLVVALRPGPKGPPRSLGAHIRRLLGPRSIHVTPETVRYSLAAGQLDATLLMICGGRPGGSPGVVTVEGEGHLEAALERGRGAILAIQSFHPNAHLWTLPTGDRQATRLTDETHGTFAGSRLGRRWLHRFQLRWEDRENVERVFARPGAFGHLRKLQKRLRQNGIVLQRQLSRQMTADPLAIVEVPFLEGRLALSITPFGLARDTGAALLPVYPLRESDGRYRVVVEPPLISEPGSDRRETLTRAMCAFARRLEPWVVRYPEQWTNWNDVRVDGA